MAHIEFLIPGDIETCTGGYTYDREVVSALKAQGLRVTIRQLDADLSQSNARAAATKTIDELLDGATVLIDGLALAHLADILNSQSHRLRLIALVHHPAALETGLSPLDAERTAAAELAALESMRRIICTSRWTANALEKSGLPRDRICVVEPGVDAVFETLHAPALRRDPAVAHRDGLRMLCVATVTPRKGHDVLISALSQLDTLDWELQCIGSLDRAPAFAADIAAAIAAHDLQSRIYLRGELDKAALADAYARADLFVLASHLEGYGMVLAEARAAGLPIVATSGGAISSTLANSSAIVIDGTADTLAGTLRRLLSDRESWLELAATTRAMKHEARRWPDVGRQFAHALQAGNRA